MFKNTSYKSIASYQCIPCPVGKVPQIAESAYATKDVGMINDLGHSFWELKLASFAYSKKAEHPA